MTDGIITPCNVACGSGIVTVNSPSGSTLQCDMWLWDDMPLRPMNSPKSTEFAQTSAILEFYICFPFPQITTVDMSFWTTLGRKK